MTADNLTMPLSSLRPGQEYPGGSVNSRNYGRDQIDGMIESIKAFGILCPLLVVNAGGDHFVAAGNLRLASLRAMLKDKIIAKDYEVPVSLRADLDMGAALAASLEENIRRVPIHPVEQYEAFAELRETRGWGVAKIATAYGLKQVDVERALALGRLSPKIRAEWVKGNVRAEGAQAFTMGKNHKAQDEAFERLRKSGAWKLSNPGEIRRALVGNTEDTGRLLKVVTHKAYEAAGGTIVKDLFGSNHGVSDWPMLVKMADDIAELKCTELKADGWSWAKPVTDDNRNDRYRYTSVTGNSSSSKSTTKQRAESGCFVEIDHEGKLKVWYGLTPPKADKPAKGAKGGPVTARGFPVKQDLSNALKGRVDQWTAQATKDALVEDTYGDEVAVTLAKIVAAQIMPERLGFIPREIREALPKIREGLEPDIMLKALRRRCDLKDYFQNAPKAFVLKAIGEAMGPDHAKKLTAKKKSDVWKFAAANVPATGWLPKPMRTGSYKLLKAKRP